MGMSKIGTTYVLDVNGVSIQVTHKRVKNVNCRVGRDGTARMSVPYRMTREQVQRVAGEHARWFARAQGALAAKESIAPSAWSSGERLRVWGEFVTLRREEAESATCELEGEELVVGVPASYDSRQVELVVERWLADQLRARVEELLQPCELRVGRNASHISLRRMKTRWGSCTTRTGRIRLNVALAECPPECTEMVLVHELCHLREPNHGPRFHALMDLCYPGWRVYQRWLDQHPPRVLGACQS